MRQILYRPSWQALRVSLLAKHGNGWITVEGTKKNIAMLNHYVTMDDELLFEQGVREASSMGYAFEQERAVRLYRVINLLNATRMGNAGQGQKDSPHDQLVMEYRNSLHQRQNVMYMKDLTITDQAWKAHVIKAELITLFVHRRPYFDMVYDDLMMRAYQAQKRPGGMGKRSELLDFLDQMQEVISAET